MTKKLYNEERDTDQYDNLVMKHMLAMTAEGLHSKAEIAVELAYRDYQISQLREALSAANWFVKNFPSSHIPSDMDFVTPIDLIDKALEQTK